VDTNVDKFEKGLVKLKEGAEVVEVLSQELSVKKKAVDEKKAEV